MFEAVTGFKIVKPFLDPVVRSLCRKPYDKHKNGCPNYGKNDSCPPKAKLLPEIIDLSKPVYAVWVEFNLEYHRLRMLSKHPEWSKKQAECCLYWQNKVLNVLKCKVANVCTMLCLSGERKILTALYRPEACGVNVTETMKNIGIVLQWPPETSVYKIAIVGYELSKSG